jgi:uridine kinase
MLGIEATISNLHAQKFPIYHNHKVRAGYSNELSNVAEVLFGNSLTIIEGIPLLLSEKIRGLADQVIQVSVDENTREKRLTTKYQSRGLEPNEINHLLKLRTRTEDQLIDQSKKHATIYLDL